MDFSKKDDGFVHVRGAREHNLKNISLSIPRGALVVFTGVSGSGKSSLAFGTLYAEAQRRYLESVSPYARRLFHQMAVPQVDEITGLPPAVALQQQRGSPSTRSSVGSVTTLSNLLRMLFSRAGDYPPGQSILYAESFSTNTPQGACPNCHGLGVIYDITEKTMVPDDSLSIRERAIASWPTAWQGQNLRDILITMGYNVDIPWKELPKKDRDWILFTEEKPTVPVYAGFTHAEIKRAIRRKEEPSYMGTFSGARAYLLHTFSETQSALMKKRVLKYMVSAPCPVCKGKRLRPESLSVHFAGMDIMDISRLPIKKLLQLVEPYTTGKKKGRAEIVTQRICEDLLHRLFVLKDLGLGYLTMERSTPTLSPGEMQRLRLATQIHSNLFGVVYVLDEPSAGLHPSDTLALISAMEKLKAAGNSLFVVEHELDIIEKADWIVDVGPDAGLNGGEILYSGELPGLEKIAQSKTREYLFHQKKQIRSARREAAGWLKLRNISRNNLVKINVDFPLCVMTAVTGISGSGKSSLVSQALVELVSEMLGQSVETEDEIAAPEIKIQGEGHIKEIPQNIKRLVVVDQKPIGRTPRSNLATYTGLFDPVRKIFASTKMARARHYNAGRFSFNVASGRCPNCEGEGFVMVELLFLPNVYSPCPVCNGSRYNDKTLEVLYKRSNIADVLKMTVNEAFDFFTDEPSILRSLGVLQEVGLGYLRLGQPATELSGGEAQRIKLATELQRIQIGSTLYVLDEPTTGLHPADVERLIKQLNRLADAGNTIILVEHDMQVIAACDWVIDMGPGAGDEGGLIVGFGKPEQIAELKESKTAFFLRRKLEESI
ncbi:MAG TPA: excinuclease ABC subunit UvrA [Puia sp.]|nr:excinuclease ABC subunit UvrA [Puia sp.]